MLRIGLFLCCCFYISNVSYAQTNSYQIVGKPLHALKESPKKITFSKSLFLAPLDKYAIRSTKTIPAIVPNTFSISNQYYEHLGFFCKVELRLEQKNKLPIKFRLGEVQYVERLEGKYD